MANYQSTILPPVNKIDQPGANYPDKLDPTYGGYPSGYPAYTKTTDAGYPPVLPTAPPPPQPSDNQTTLSPSNIYPNMREYPVHLSS